MKISCGICLDLYTASDEVSSGPCGHVFHTKCCLRWFETNKHTCPACRKSCPEKQLRRLFFSEGANADATESDTDVNTLYNKVDSLTFNLRLAENETKKLREERDTLSVKNVAIREEFKNLEGRFNAARDDMYTANAKIKLLKCEKNKFDALNKELKDTKDKLELYRTIEVAVKGSVEEVSNRLHEIGDYSKAAKDMSYICLSLKKELKNKNDYESRLQKELSQKSRKIVELKTTLETQSRELKLLTTSNQSLTSDIKHLEEELEQTRTKMRQLQEAIVSPSGDVKSSAINRLIFEHPAPLNLTLFEDSPKPPSGGKIKPLADFFDMSGDESDATSSSATTQPPFKKKKLVPTQSPCKEVTNSFRKPVPFVRTGSSGLTGLLGSMAVDGYKCQPRQAGKTEGMYFDGLGGHSKADNFPQPIKKDFKLKPIPFSKKPKGVSRLAINRPKTGSSSQASVLSTTATIDKFFTLDTP